MKKIIFLLLLFTSCCFSQNEKEITPPFNIKTVSFIQNGQNVPAIFQINDTFQLEFDDLFANEANYYYAITHCDYDWKPSELSKNEYLQGFDDQRIQDYANSFNTLQLYAHYKLQIPNQKTQCKVSGNYILKILNEDREIIFSKKFILYENLATVPLQIRRSRNMEGIDAKQNLDFTIKSSVINFQNPVKNVKILIVKNGQFQTAISNIIPQYTMGNDLIYRYDKETQFWGGNEFLNFDTKNIRVPYQNVSFVDSKNGIYDSHLYTNAARLNSIYTFYPDIDGNFFVRKFGSENSAIEADYSWVFFSLSAPTFFEKEDIYVSGMFNNFGLTPENKMDYNAEKKVYEKAIMIKQGFTNFQYVVADSKGKIDDENAIDGNHFQTENNYTILVYYRENGQRYDQVIGKGDASSINIIN